MFVWLTHLLSLYSSKPPRGMITRGKREGIFANPKGPFTSSTAFFHVFGRTSTVCGTLSSDWLSFPKGCPATRAEGSETRSLEREGGSVALSQARTIWFVLAAASERHGEIITPQPFLRNRSIYISQWSVDRASKQSETESKMRACPSKPKTSFDHLTRTIDYIKRWAESMWRHPLVCEYSQRKVRNGWSVWPSARPAAGR